MLSELTVFKVADLVRVVVGLSVGESEISVAVVDSKGEISHPRHSNVTPSDAPFLGSAQIIGAAKNQFAVEASAQTALVLRSKVKAEVSGACPQCCLSDRVTETREPTTGGKCCR